MLVWEPKDRISITEALAHPYLAELHFPEDEPNAVEMVSGYDFDFEKFKLST